MQRQKPGTGGTGPGVPRTSFVGRAVEMQRVAELLTEGAVVTLTGAAGSGKTRLALEIARSRRDDFTGDPLWVDLASVASGDLVAGAVATVLGLRGRPGVDLLEDIVAAIGDSRRLVILDNCEHLIEASASLCQFLVTRCDGLRVLATSRVPMRISGETVFSVPPLNIEAEAVRLFADRARSARADFDLSPANEADVKQICRKLDGLPLAIELAAAWAGMMSPSELIPLLDRRFSVLTTGSRGAPERQRTLRSAIDWSHELLGPEDRTLFRRLGVFAGSFSRDAAEHIGSDDRLPAGSILDRLANLCAASMVVADTPASGVTRYRLLESLRAYGLERLAESGEEDLIRGRHLRYFADLAEKTFRARMQGGRNSVIDVLEPDRDNVRAALDWGLEHEPEPALGLAGTLVEDLRASLFTFGEMRGRLAALIEKSSPDTERHAWALIAYGYTALTAAADDQAVALFESSIRLFRRLGESCGEAWAHLALGHMKWIVGDLAGASRELRTSEAMHAAMGNRLGRHRARLRAALTHVLDPALEDSALRQLEESIPEARELGDPFGAGMAHNWLGLLEVNRGSTRSARPHFLEAIPLLKKDSVVAISFFGLAACCLETDPERSLRLIGAGEAYQPRAGLPKPPFLARMLEGYLPRAMARVGGEKAERAFAEGLGMSMEEAIELALAPDAPASGQGRQAGRPGGLTARETEIANLVADGLSNREIAEKLSLSVRTVETHVDRVLTKLGFHSRGRLGSWVHEQELP